MNSQLERRFVAIYVLVHVLDTGNLAGGVLVIL
jgi:hypothetical protein